MHTRLIRLVPAPALALALLAPSARAQLDLPERPIRERSTPEETVDLPAGPADSLRDRVQGEGVGPGTGGLDLPADLRGALPGADPHAGGPPVAGVQPLVPDPGSLSRPVEFILGELRKARGINDTLVQRAVLSLVTLGERGIEGARVALLSEEGPLILAGALVLMGSDDPMNAHMVRERLRGKLPRTEAAGIVDAVVTFEPSRASARYLAQLLEHPQGSVRTVAQRHLQAMDDPGVLQFLRGPMGSERTSTRLAAFTVAESLAHPARIEFLFAGLRDKSAKVASRAAQALAAVNDAAVQRELLVRAFGERWILREGAYALLALMEREDLHFVEVLDASHREPLLHGLDSSDSFVSGVCAAGLAGIGFRSPDPRTTPWLNREVPHALVRAVSGSEFHSDFSSLQRTAQRRLALITGESLGSDGPAWLDWWKASAAGFTARRAAILASEADAPGLRLRYDSTLGEGEAFQLLGPGLAGTDRTAPAGDGSGPAPGEALYLSEAQAREVFALLLAEGVLGSEKLPGARGSVRSGAREIQLDLAGGCKLFTFGEGSSEPWFERIAAAALSLRERNRWQRYPDPEEHASRLDLWRTEAEWWETHADERERGLRLKHMVLTVLPVQRPTERGPALRELERLLAVDGLGTSGDFAPLVSLLRQESFVGPRAQTLVRLALASARLAGPGSGPADGPLPTPMVRELVGALIETLGAPAAEEVAEVLRQGGRDEMRWAAAEPRPFLRAVAAATLAEGDAAEDFEILVQLLRDPVEEVEVAAVLALGEHRVEAARNELLVRARLGTPRVRSAALRAVGRIGGEAVLEALVLGLADPLTEIRLASAHGLASLGDPTAAPMFVRLLREGRRSPFFEPAREGLLALGEDAWTDLLRVIHAPADRAKREAALILARQGVPQAVPVLLAILTDNPGDAYVASELAILTCIDYRSEVDPADAWWDWWDGVVHGDSLAWLRASVERAGLTAPPGEALAGEGDREGAAFLVEMMSLDDPSLVERGRRELSRLLGRDLGELPLRGTERESWLYTLREAVDEHWDG